RPELRGRAQALVVGVPMVQGPGESAAEQILLDADHRGAGIEALRHPLLEVARAVELFEKPGFAERAWVGGELVARAPRQDGSEHSRLDRRMAALDARGVEKAGVIPE